MKHNLYNCCTNLHQGTSATAGHTQTVDTSKTTVFDITNILGWS